MIHPVRVLGMGVGEGVYAYLDISVRRHTIYQIWYHQIQSNFIHLKTEILIIVIVSNVREKSAISYDDILNGM